MTRRPDLFIVGAPKSGTSSLYAYLEGHPEIYMASIKEPFYFSPDVIGSLRRPFQYPGDEPSYLSLFDAAGTEKRLGEASTSYLVSRMAPSLVHEFQPDAYIVAMLRNPVDLVDALHNERVSNGVEPIVDFEAALDADDDRRAGRRLPHGFNALGAVYRDNALLGEQLERWLQTFGHARVHTIVFDDFAADTATEYRRVLEFLGVDPKYQPATFEAQNPSWRRRGGILRTVVDSRALHWIRRRLLPAVIGEEATFRAARRFSRSRFNRRRHERPTLRRELRRELETWFADDVAHLGELIGRDLASEWFRGATSGSGAPPAPR